MAKEQEKVLITGGSGFIGSYFLAHSSKDGFLVPSHQELDITKKQAVFAYFATHLPHTVINFAAFVNLGESEKERGNKNGVTWQTNVVGVENLLQTCRNHNTFLVQISTGAVFPGNKTNPGPYPENVLPGRGKELSWYGLSKLEAEKIIKNSKVSFAIVRIDFPFGNPQSPKDSVHKAVKGILAGNPIFTDQYFTPTYLADLVNTLSIILKQRHRRIFHVTCRGVITKMEFSQYLAKNLGLKEPLKEGSAAEFMRQPGRPPISLRGGLLTEKTEKQLGLKFHGWQEAIDRLDLRIEFFTQ